MYIKTKVCVFIEATSILCKVVLIGFHGYQYIIAWTILGWYLLVKKKLVAVDWIFVFLLNSDVEDQIPNVMHFVGEVFGR